MSNRREFIVQFSVGAGVLIAGHAVAAMVSEGDPQAKALKYHADGGKMSPPAPKGNNCGTCHLYQDGGAASGGCPLFAGKQVAKAGWCSAFVKKS